MKVGVKVHTGWFKNNDNNFKIVANYAKGWALLAMASTVSQFPNASLKEDTYADNMKVHDVNGIA